MSNSSAGRRLAMLLGPAVEGVRLDLEGVEVVSAGKRRVVRVTVDKDGGVSLDDVAHATRAISAVLDSDPSADAVLGSAPYVLEVSSPGVERPLTDPRHWRRALGRLVSVTLATGTQVAGRVIEADDDGVRLAVDGSPQSERALKFGEIRQARARVEFNRPESAEGDADGETGYASPHAEESR